MPRYAPGRSGGSMEREIVQGVCIDQKGTRIRDDAIWGEEARGAYRVSVSIADVAALVPQNSDIARRAYERGFTRYNESGSEPMLPEEVLRAASLGVPEQHAITISVDLGDQLELKEIRVVPSLLKNVGSLSFEEADRMLSENKSPLCGRLREWSRLAERLRARRRSGGAIILDPLGDDPKYSLEEGCARWLIHTRTMSSNRMVEEFVLLASNALALWCRERSVPILYLNHTDPMEGEERARLLRDIDRAYAGDLSPGELNRLQKHVATMFHEAYYSPVPERHSALNMLHTHVSSPMRRYADLVVHQVLACDFFGKEQPYTEPQLKQIASHLNALRREIPFASNGKAYDALGQRARKSTTRFIRELRFAAEEEPWLDEGLERQIYLRARTHGLDSETTFCTLVLARRSGVLWRSSKQEVLRALAERPCLVRSVFGMAHAELNWPLPAMDTNEDASGMCMAIARIEIPGEPLAAVSGWLPNKERAMESAALSLLGSVSGLPDSNAEENLGRYCALYGLCTPRYSFSRSACGARPFRCVAQTNVPFTKSNGTAAIAYAATEIEARARAARALLTKLIFDS